METYRVKFTDIDSSEVSVNSSEGLKGFFNINAPKGTGEAKLFPKGSGDLIKRLIGYPCLTFPAIQDVLDFNSKYPCYVSAPCDLTINKGYAAITQYGVYAFQSVDGNITSNIDIKPITVVNGVEGFTLEIDSNDVVVEYTQATYDKYNSIGAKLKLNDGTPQDFDESLSVTLTETSLSDVVVTIVEGTIESSKVIFTVNQVSQTSIPLTLSIKDLELEDVTGDGLTADKSKFDVKISYKEDSYPHVFTSREISGNLDFQAELSDGTKNYIVDKVSKYSSIEISNINLEAIIEGTSPLGAISDSVTLVGESRVSNVDADSWSEAYKDIYDDVKIFIDPEGTIDSTVAGSLRANKKTSTIISVFDNYPGNIEKGSKLQGMDSETILTGTPDNKPIKQVRGFVQYYNKFKVYEGFTNTNYWTTFLGKVGIKLADIMVIASGGVAPMFLNDAQGLGGQLDVDFEDIYYTFSEEAQKNFDTIGVNPLFWDKNYGVYIGGQKTSFSKVGVISDWGFIGHSMAFDLFRDEVKQTILIPQIGKALSPKNYEIRGDQMQKLIDARVEGAKAIWDSARYEHVNIEENKALRKYVVKVWVKVFPFAEETELIFENVAQ